MTAAREFKNTPTRQLLTEFRDWIQTLPCWSGRVATRNLRILCSICDLGIEANNFGLTFSTRQIAKRTGITHTTVGKAIRDLLRDDWLSARSPRDRKSRIDEDGQAPKYNIRVFRLPAAGAILSLPSTSFVSESNCTTTEGRTYVSKASGATTLTMEAFDSDGLGTSAGRVYAALVRGEPLTVAELAGQLRQHQQTVRGALRELLAHKLVASDGRKRNTRWTALERDMGEVAGELEYAGQRRQKRIEQAKRDQKGFRDYLAHCAARRLDPRYRPRTISPMPKRPALPSTRQTMDAQLDQMRDHDRDSSIIEPRPSIREYWGEEESA